MPHVFPMRSLFLSALVLGSGLLLGACDSSTASGDSAMLRVRLTDAPFPFDLAESADVTITRIELLASGGGDAEGDSLEVDLDRIVVFDGRVDLNLLDLRDGVDTLLVDRLSIPADGSYDQLRVFVGEDAAVRFFDGSVYELKLPSAQQSGIKIRLPSYEMDSEDDVLDVLIDFDVEQSFVTRGNPSSANFQGFLFRPVLEVESFEILDVRALEDE